jgi:hypothetical protein
VIVETSEVRAESKVVLYYESEASRQAREDATSAHVIDLAVRAEIKHFDLEVVFASADSIIARAKDHDDDFHVGVKASLVYPMFSESWRVPVKISPVTDLGPETYSLTPLEEWEYLNRRAYVRVKVDFPVTLLPSSRERRPGIACLARDISHSGIAIAMPPGVSLELDDEVSLTLHLSDGDLELLAEVASNRGDVLGLQFHKVNDAADKRIGKVIFQAQIAKKRLLVDD